MADSGRQLRMQRRAEMVRTEFLDAAAAVLAEEGVSALTVEAVASRVGYSPASVYNYFSGKDELLERVLERAASLLVEGLRRVPTGASTLEEGLEAYLRQALSAFDLHAPVVQSLLKGLPSVSEEVREHLKAFRLAHREMTLTNLSAALEQLLGERKLKVPLRIAAWGLLAVLSERSMQQMLDLEDSTEALDQISNIVRIFLYGVLEHKEEGSNG